MNRLSFNVIAEPWIPVIRRDGSRDELGILQCLKQSHELKEIYDSALIIEFGIYRLLVAFVLDILILADRRPEDYLDLKNLIENRQFYTQMIENYTKQCGDVFDLFHPERPFLQAKMDTSELKPLACLFPATPSGTNVSHWHHQPEDNFSVSVHEAVRLLTTISPFMIAGGSGLSPSINGAPPIYALPTGENVFETIVLNIPLRANQESGNGVIAWRNDRSPGQERSQATTVESLTWRPRQIQLKPEIDDAGKVYVRSMKFKKGDSTRLDWIDASIAYRYSKDKITPIRMRENHPLWRDAGPLLFLNDNTYGQGENKISFSRPDVIVEAFKLTDVGRPLMVQFYGMRTDMKMKVYEWVKSTWSVPVKLGRSPRLGNLVQHELERAEQAAYNLRTCIKILYPHKGEGNKKALGTIADRCERAYWQRLEFSFHPLMNAFAALDPDAPDNPDLIAMTATEWRETIRSLALEQFEFAVKDMDADSDGLERQVHARALLKHKIKEVLYGNN